MGRLKKKLARLSENHWTEERIKALLLEEANREGDRGKVLWPFRVALTGKKESAGPFEIAATLGKARVLLRLDDVLRKL